MNEKPEGNKTQRQITILDSNECSPCEEIKKANKEKIESGEIRVLDIRSDEALELLQKAGAPDKIKYPSALVEDGKGVRVCEMFHDKDFTLVACGDEIIALREPKEEKTTPQQLEESTQPPTA